MKVDWDNVFDGVVLALMVIIGLDILFMAGTAQADSLAKRRWEIKADSKNAAYAFELYRGETVDLEPYLTSYGATVNLQDVYQVLMRYRSTNTPAGYYNVVTGAVLNATNGQVRITWSPTNETPADLYVYTIAVKTLGGDTLSGRGTFKLVGVVDGGVTNIPHVSGSFDWSNLEHLNIMDAPFLSEADLVVLQNQIAGLETGKVDRAEWENTNAAIRASITNAIQLAGTNNVTRTDWRNTNVAHEATMSNLQSQVSTLSTGRTTMAQVQAQLVGGGDLSGALSNATVVALRGVEIATGEPQDDGDGLVWSTNQQKLVYGKVAGSGGTSISNLLVMSNTAAQTDVASSQIGLYRSIRPGNLPTMVGNVGGFEVFYADLAGITLRSGTLSLLNNVLTCNPAAYDGSASAPAYTWGADRDLGSYRLSWAGDYGVGQAVNSNLVWFWAADGIHLFGGARMFGVNYNDITNKPDISGFTTNALRTNEWNAAWSWVNGNSNAVVTGVASGMTAAAGLQDWTNSLVTNGLTVRNLSATGTAAVTGELTVRGGRVITSNEVYAAISNSTPALAESNNWSSAWSWVTGNSNTVVQGIASNTAGRVALQSWTNSLLTNGLTVRNLSATGTAAVTGELTVRGGRVITSNEVYAAISNSTPALAESNNWSSAWSWVTGNSNAVVQGIASNTAARVALQAWTNSLVTNGLTVRNLSATGTAAVTGELTVRGGRVLTSNEVYAAISNSTPALAESNNWSAAWSWVTGNSNTVVQGIASNTAGRVAQQAWTNSLLTNGLTVRNLSATGTAAVTGELTVRGGRVITSNEVFAAISNAMPAVSLPNSNNWDAAWAWVNGNSNAVVSGIESNATAVAGKVQSYAGRMTNVTLVGDTVLATGATLHGNGSTGRLSMAAATSEGDGSAITLYGASSLTNSGWVQVWLNEGSGGGRFQIGQYPNQQQLFWVNDSGAAWSRWPMYVGAGSASSNAATLGQVWAMTNAATMVHTTRSQTYAGGTTQTLQHANILGRLAVSASGQTWDNGDAGASFNGDANGMWLKQDYGVLEVRDSSDNAALRITSARERQLLTAGGAIAMDIGLASSNMVRCRLPLDMGGQVITNVADSTLDSSAVRYDRHASDLAGRVAASSGTGTNLTVYNGLVVRRTGNNWEETPAGITFLLGGLYSRTLRVEVGLQGDQDVLTIIPARNGYLAMAEDVAAITNVQPTVAFMAITNSTVYALTTNYATITNWHTVTTNHVTVTASNATVTTAGYYDIDLQVSFDGANTSPHYEFELFTNGVGCEAISFERDTSSVLTGSGSTMGTLQLPAGTVLSVRGKVSSANDATILKAQWRMKLLR